MDILTALFLALTVVYFVFALRKTEKAILALPLFFPLYLFKTQIAGVPFTLVEMFVYVTALAYAMRAGRGYGVQLGRGHSVWTGREAAAGKKQFHLRAAEIVRHELFWPVALFIAAAVIGTAVAQEKTLMIDGNTVFYGQKVALGILKGWIINPLIMVALFFAAVKKSKQILTLLNYYTVSAFLLSFYALFQVVTQSYTTPDARASGPFESANYLALYIAPAVLYLLIRTKESVFSVVHLEKYSFWKIPFRRRKAPLEHPENFFFIGAFLVMFMVLLFTKSYAAMLAVTLAAAFYFGLEYLEYHRRKELKRVPWKMFAAAAFLIVAVIFTVFLIDPAKWQTVFQFQLRNSSSVRVEVYTIAVTLLKENLLTGIGLGQFPLHYQLESTRILGHAPYEWNMLHPHNLYLALWLNMGLLGVAAFFWLLFIILRKCWKHFKTFAFHKFAEEPKLRVVGFSLLLIILFHGFLDTPFFKNDLALLFWLIVCVILLPVEEKKAA